jgi:hypothetical protein
MDEAERARQPATAEPPVLLLAGVDEEEPPEPNVVRGID